MEVSATAENRIKGMIAIRNSVRTLIELQTEDYPDSEIKAEQERLNRLYDTFSGKYGLINSRANTSAFSQDSSFSLLSALEIIGEDGELERKADMFSKRTIKPHTPVTSVDTASEALAVSLGEKATIDMDYMMELSGKSENEIFTSTKLYFFSKLAYMIAAISDIQMVVINILAHSVCCVSITKSNPDFPSIGNIEFQIVMTVYKSNLLFLRLCSILLLLHFPYLSFLLLHLNRRPNTKRVYRTLYSSEAP